MDKPADLAAMEPLDWVPEVFRTMIARDNQDRIWRVKGNEWVMDEQTDLIDAQ